MAVSVTAGMAILGACAQARTPVRVQPGHGGSHTTFTISFRAPFDTTIDPYNETYEMSVKGLAHTSCSGEESVYTSSGHGLRKGQVVHVRVRSPYRHARWCPGGYSGAVYELSVNPSSTCEQEQNLAGCTPGETLVGTFRFRVRR